MQVDHLKFKKIHQEMRNTTPEVDHWFSSSEMAEMQLDGLSSQPTNITRRAKSEGWKSRPREGRGGGMEYAVSGLPDNIRAQVVQHMVRERIDNVEPVQVVGNDMAYYTSLPQWQRDGVDKWLSVIHMVDGLDRSGRSLAIEEWNARHPEAVISEKRLYAVLSNYRRDGIRALVPKYGQHRTGKTGVTDEAFTLFKRLYMQQGQPSARGCWRKVLATDSTDSGGLPTDERAALLRLEREVPEQVIYLARHGEAKWKRKYASFIERDPFSISAGEVWVSDHRQVDVIVTSTEATYYHFVDGEIMDVRTGEVLEKLPAKLPTRSFRAWVTAWIDMRSLKWLSWHLHEESPNSDHVMQTFSWAVQKYGLPSVCYIDNGKDYRALDFAGGRPKTVRVQHKEMQLRGMLAQLGVQALFATPYNAQAKVIERQFQETIDRFERHCAGYTGGAVGRRPEALQSEAHLPFNVFETAFNEVLNSLESEASEGRYLMGLTRAQAFAKYRMGNVRTVNADALQLFCMRTSKRQTIRRNGVFDARIGQWYWGEWMDPAKGRPVYLRRDPKRYQEAYVFDADTDQLLGIGVLGAWQSSALAKSDVERGVLERHIARQRKQRKQAVQQARKERVDIETLAMLNKMEVGRVSAADVTPNSPRTGVILQLNRTPMDVVVREAERLRATGSDNLDLTQIAPQTQSSPPRLRLWVDE